jgi:hypothetical protein
MKPRMGYQLVSLIPEEDRVEEIRRTFRLIENRGIPMERLCKMPHSKRDS